MLGSCDNRLMDTGQAQGNLSKEAVLKACEVLLQCVFYREVLSDTTSSDPGTWSCVPLQTADCYKSV